MYYYLSSMVSIESLCDSFESVILKTFFPSSWGISSNAEYFNTPLFRQLFNPIKCAINASLLFNIRIVELNKDFLEESIFRLGTLRLSRDDIKKLVSDIKNIFTLAREEIKQLIDLLDKKREEENK